MKKLWPSIALLFLLTCNISLTAKEKISYPISEIPDSLIEDAYVVVRTNSIDFHYKSPVHASEKRLMVITVLDRKGLGAAHFQEWGDQFKTLKSFRAVLYSASGTEIRKYNRKDLTQSSYSSELATDNLQYYLECVPPTFPFTILYEYEMEWKDGIIIFPPFTPQSGYRQSLQSAGYSLTYPQGTEIMHKTIAWPVDALHTTDKKTETMRWTLSPLKAIKEELFDPSPISFLPQLYTAPKEFSYEGHKASIASINDICLWQQSLNQGRDQLDEVTRAKVLAMTDTITDTRRKVEVLYNYLGAHTRYESIQLGLGGFQPIAAAEVCRTGFGDCKGLSNYLHAMLKVTGIPSYYSLIRLDEYQKDLSDDFTAFIKTNHIVLQVPLAGDTLWLECTNTRNPFGFVHNSIAGHHALVTTEQGGYMTRLPDYPDSVNIENNRMKIVLQSDGQAKVNHQRSWEMKYYDLKSSLVLAKASDQTDYLRSTIKLPNASIEQMSWNDIKNSTPRLEVNFEWSTAALGTKTGNRLFIPVNCLRSESTAIPKGPRKPDIVLNVGTTDTENIELILPDDYEIEQLPGPVFVKNDFGSFSSLLIAEESKIIILQTLSIKSGRWDASAWDQLLTLYNTSRDAYRNKIILRKRN